MPPGSRRTSPTTGARAPDRERDGGAAGAGATASP